MDFFKSAVAAVGNVKGPPFPYTFGDQVTLDQSVWKLFNGVKRVGMIYGLVPWLSLTNNNRKINPTVVFSHLTSTKISLDYPWPGMLFGSCGP